MLPIAARRSCRGFVLLAALLGAGEAAADTPRVLVLPFSGEVPDAPDAPRRLTQVVARAAGLTGADVTIGQATFADAATLAGCADESPECFGQVAAALHADQVINGTISLSADGSQVEIAIKYFHKGEVTETQLATPKADLETMVAAIARQAPAIFVGSDRGADQPPPPPPPPDDKDKDKDKLPPPPPPPRDQGGGGTSLLPWVAMGTGVALAGAGGVFLYLGRQKQAEIDDFEPHTVQDFERLVELEDQGKRYMLIGNGLLIGGGAIAAAGVVLFLLDGGGDSPETPATASVAPALLPGGVGLTFTVRTR